MPRPGTAREINGFSDFARVQKMQTSPCSDAPLAFGG